MKYFIIFFWALLIPTQSVFAANLSLVNHSGRVEIVMSTNQAINAVGIKITYDPELIQVNNLNFDKSFCQLFIVQKIDNENGLIEIACGLPNPGIMGPAVVGEFDYSVRAATTAAFAFVQGTQVLANDGLGTDVLISSSSLQIQSLRPVIEIKIPDFEAGAELIIVKSHILSENFLLTKNLA